MKNPHWICGHEWLQRTGYFRQAIDLLGKAAIAQLVEHIIRNDGVGGSNPSCGTTIKSGT
jgi:hypothetical protein